MVTTKKTSTKTTTTKKAAGKVVAAEQLTLVDALPVATEPPAAAAPEDMGPQKVRAALHPEHNNRGRGRSEAEKRESYALYRANKEGWT